MKFNLYVPVADGTISVDDDAFTSVYDVAEGWYKISWTPEIYSFASKDVVIYYGGAVSNTITLDVLTYATNVLKYEENGSLKYGCNTEGAILVYEMMQYKAAVAKYIGKTVPSSYSTFTDLYNDHGEECTCKKTSAISKVDKGQTKDGVTIQYLVELDRIGIVIGGVEAGKDVSVTYYYKLDGADTSKDFDVVWENGEYIVNVPAAFLYKNLEFNIDGDTFVFSLTQYYYNISTGEDGLDAKIEALETEIAPLKEYISAVESLQKEIKALQDQIAAATEAGTETNDLQQQLNTKKTELENLQKDEDGNPIDLDAKKTALAEKQSQKNQCTNTQSLIDAMYQYSVAAFEYKYEYQNIAQ